MRPEIRSASMFLADLLRLGHTLSDHQVRLFRATLEDLLRLHYHHHWFPERPFKGSGYRCIRINHRMDPMIAKAAVACGINDSTLLRNVFPNELTMWIDPREVSYRIGENGSICVLYDEVDARQHEVRLSSTTSSSSSSSSSLLLLTSPPPPMPLPSSSSSSSSSSLLTTSNAVRSHNHRNANNNNNSMSTSTNINNAAMSCKDSVRGMDNFIMDRRNLNLDQFAPYVSS